MKGRIDFSKDVLKNILLSYGENGLAEKVDNLTEDQIKTMGEYAARHVGQHNLVAKTIVYGAIEYFEGKSRPPIRSRRDLSFYQNATTPEKEESQKDNWWTRLLRRFKN